MEQLQTGANRFQRRSCSKMNYLGVHAYLLRIFPFLLIFLLQEVTDDLKEILWR